MCIPWISIRYFVCPKSSLIIWIRFQWNDCLKKKKNELEVLSIANQKKIMQYVKENFTFRNLGVYICLSTGMRIGEICGLKWSDINLSAETISVNRTIERIYIIDEGKRHTELIISTPKTQNSNQLHLKLYLFYLFLNIFLHL